MKKKMLFIYNPNAGTGAIKNKLSDVIETFIRADYEVTIFATQEKKDATKIVAEQASSYDYIVCSGGDGTLNEVTDGLMTLEKRPPCGYLPAGTVNDFATSLGIPKNIRKAAQIAVSGKLFPYDIGSLNGDYFNYVAAFGAFTDVSYETPQTTKNILGKMAYFLEGVIRLPQLQKYEIKIRCNEKVIKDTVILGMVTNSKYVGGFKGIDNKSVELNDGLFEAIFIRYPKNPIELQQIVNALLKKEASNDFVYSFRTSDITIECSDEIRWTIDGEFGGSYRKAHILNHPQAISFRKAKDKVV